MFLYIHTSVDWHGADSDQGSDALQGTRVRYQTRTCLVMSGPKINLLIMLF